MHLLSIIIPVYNEESNVDQLYRELLKYAGEDFELLWVDDGSMDNTLLEIERIARSDNRVKCLSLSRNFGHQDAIRAGLLHARGDLFIVMDGDLQHPPSLIPQMIAKIGEGYDIVNTRRTSTMNISSFKKISSKLYYAILKKLADIEVPEGHADFRIFNQKVYDAIVQFKERDIFLRGIFNWVGFRSATMAFAAVARNSGTTKYSLKKMMRLGLSGIISFSTTPLKIAFALGCSITLLSFLFLVYAIYEHFHHNTLPGWTSIIGVVILLGGIQLCFIGILGIYIAQLIRETKKRPTFIVNRKINL